MSTGAWAGRDERFPRWPFVLVLAFGVFVRFHHLGLRSVWTDEGSAWTGASLPFAGMLRRCVERDASPPLYYLLTSLPLRIGDDAWHLRLVSALASVGLVWLTYRLARLVTHRGPATLAAVIAAVAPFQVMYAQEARTYTLVALFSMLALYTFARAVLHGRRAHWAWYVLVSTAGLYTQTIAVLLWPAQIAALVLTRSGRRQWRPWLLAQLAIAVLYAPWLIASLSMAAHLGSSHWYIPTPAGRGMIQVLRSVLISPVPLIGPMNGGVTRGLDAILPRALAWILLTIVIVVPLAASLDSLLRRDSRRSVIGLLWLAWVLPLLGVLVLSLRSPLLLARYFVFAGIPVAVLMAAGIAALPRRALRGAWGGMIVAIMLLGLWRYDRDYTKERWSEVARDIASHTRTATPTVLVPFDRDPLEFYADDVRPPLEVIEYSHPDEPFAARYTPIQQDTMAAAARRALAGRGELWLVIRSANNQDRRAAVARAMEVASEGRIAVEDSVWRSTAGPLRVVRYEPVAADTVPAAPERRRR